MNMTTAPRKRRIRDAAISVAVAILLACLVVRDVKTFSLAPFFPAYGLEFSTRFDVTLVVKYDSGSHSIEWSAYRESDHPVWDCLGSVSIGGRNRAKIGQTVLW